MLSTFLIFKSLLNKIFENNLFFIGSFFKSIYFFGLQNKFFISYSKTEYYTDNISEN